MKQKEELVEELSGMLARCSHSGKDKVLSEPGELPDTVTKAQAYRLFGRLNVDRWCMEGRIHPFVVSGSGKKKMIDRLKIEAVARASNRSCDLPVADR